mmetsp:Transcript_103436/g.267528  ORF Transcript_103436/g.267528 Transcript_103436/m.267528 type:complete len:251 (-) Transcript_103436:6-758(-)
MLDASALVLQGRVHHLRHRSDALLPSLRLANIITLVEVPRELVHNRGQRSGDAGAHDVCLEELLHLLLDPLEDLRDNVCRVTLLRTAGLAEVWDHVLEGLHRFHGCLTARPQQHRAHLLEARGGIVNHIVYEVHDVILQAHDGVHCRLPGPVLHGAKLLLKDRELLNHLLHRALTSLRAQPFQGLIHGLLQLRLEEAPNGLMSLFLDGVGNVVHHVLSLIAHRPDRFHGVLLFWRPGPTEGDLADSLWLL